MVNLLRGGRELAGKLANWQDLFEKYFTSLIPPNKLNSSTMNSTSRYYLEASSWTTDNLTLTGDEAHHCCRVLRAKVGDPAEVFDGEGTSVTGEIIHLEKEKVIIRPTSDREISPKPKMITLNQAIPKGGNMELIVQKAAELGVSVIQPLITKNTVARAEQIAKKQAKWQRIALEACKQCGQNYLPIVKPSLSLADWINSQIPDTTAPDSTLKIIAALHPESKPFNQAFTSDAQAASLLIGPEGDFSEAEYKQILAVNFLPITLGEIILRVETATLYCISVIKHELDKSDRKI